VASGLRAVRGPRPPAVRGQRDAAAGRGPARVRSHCRFVPLLIHFIPYLLRDLVALFLIVIRQCDRTLGPAAGQGGGGGARAAGEPARARGAAGRGLAPPSPGEHRLALCGVKPCVARPSMDLTCGRRRPHGPRRLTFARASSPAGAAARRPHLGAWPPPSPAAGWLGGAAADSMRAPADEGRVAIAPHALCFTYREPRSVAAGWQP
jgi:hypothetical protein